MRTYTITKRPTLLECQDRVIFGLKGKTLEYHVSRICLHYFSGSNAEVFSMLDVDKEKLAEAAYGYKPLGGDWPEYTSGDYPAATRLVNALFDRIATLGTVKKTTKAKAPKPLHRWAIIGSGKTRGRVEAATMKDAKEKFEREKRGGSPLPSGWTVVDRGPVEVEAIEDRLGLDKVKLDMDSGDTIEFWLANTSGGVTLYGRYDRFTKAILSIWAGGELYRYTGAGLRGLKTTKDGRIIL